MTVTTRPPTAPPAQERLRRGVRHAGVPEGDNAKHRVLVIGDLRNEPDETLFVSLADATNASISRARAVGTIVNDDPVPSISIDNAVVREGNGGTRHAVFTVRLSHSSGLPVTVKYATANGTARAGSDYQAASGALTFNPGERSKLITVVVDGDRRRESNETFFVNLSDPANATIADGQGRGIHNDDRKATDGATGVTPAWSDVWSGTLRSQTEAW